MILDSPVWAMGPSIDEVVTRMNEIPAVLNLEMRQIADSNGPFLMTWYLVTSKAIHRCSVVEVVTLHTGPSFLIR